MLELLPPHEAKTFPAVQAATVLLAQMEVRESSTPAEGKPPEPPFTLSQRDYYLGSADQAP